MVTPAEQAPSVSKERELNQQRNTVKTPELRKIGSGALLKLNNRLEELFFQFCVTYLETPEREGKLPKDYSTLSQAEVHELFVNSDAVVDTSDELPTTDAEFERARISEAIELLKANKDRAPIIRNAQEMINPLGELDDVTLVITADDHNVPSSAIEGTRSYAFARYILERVLMGIPLLKSQEKRWGSFPAQDASEPQPKNRLEKILKVVAEVRAKIKLFAADPAYRGVNSNNPGDQLSVDNEDLLSSDTLMRQYIESHEVRTLFDDWLINFISSEAFRKTGSNDLTKTDNSKPIIMSMGDKIHGGAAFLDQVDVEAKYLRMLEAVSHKNASLNPALFSLFGNHDQDGRIPEAVGHATELFGQRIFTQDVGNVRIVALDTNIESEAWINVFMARATPEQKAALKEKQAMQEIALQRMQDHDGPVVLLTHHPARAIEAFGVKRKALQNSNVQGIYSGHTHVEAHLSTPLVNKAGERIALHVLESVTRSKDGKPVPPKAYTLRIDGSSIGPVRTMQQNQEDFTKAHERALVGNFGLME